MCEKCKAVGELAREVYASKGIYPDEKGLMNCMVRTDEAVHIIGNEGVFFFQKGVIIQADENGVKQVDNHSVFSIGMTELMDFTISMLQVYDNAVGLGLISEEKIKEDFTELLAYVSRSIEDD